MGLRSAWKVVSTGWVIEYPNDQSPAGFYILNKPAACASRYRKSTPAAVCYISGIAPPPVYEVRGGDISPLPPAVGEGHATEQHGETFQSLPQSGAHTDLLESANQQEGHNLDDGQGEGGGRQPEGEEQSQIAAPEREPAEDRAEQEPEEEEQEQEQPPPPYTQPRQFGPPRPWTPNMSNAETRHWLTEHFLCQLHDLPAAVAAGSRYRYGSGNALFRMSWSDLLDVDGVVWAGVVWRALGR
ncbi:hypothetical protein PVAG01_05583 [Phlyctema vagabunda]|uniref:Uncharacterized protein n=1 Tax=Phlyctema vagabunda TaxID=108571 RepID=A0ABR4PKI7_9HELO